MGVPVRIDLDTEAPHNLGALCARGHYNLELLVHPKRNLAATINRRRVPWTSGMTKVAGKIKDIKEADGGDALGIIVGTFIFTFFVGTLKEVWASGNWAELISFKVFFSIGLFVFSLFIPKIIKRVKGEET